MKVLFFIIAWCLLLVLCWPLAILAILLWPLVWVLGLPIRLVAIVCHALLAFLPALALLPARVLGHRDRSTGRVS